MNHFCLSMNLVTIILSVILIFGCGRNSDQSAAEIGENQKENEAREMKKVTGIGGIFFKTKDPKKMKEWYQKHLGLKTDEYGTLFESRNSDNPDKKEYLQWSPFSEDTKYFAPSKKEFMINYRVANLEKLLEELSKAGVEIVGKMETYEYGKFAHIMDPEGNKIELWEPRGQCIYRTGRWQDNSLGVPYRTVARIRRAELCK
jgi:predicted enzyme related to lactoylglutathione lyase